MKKAVLGLLLVAVLVSMAGCVVVPVPAPPRAYDKVVSEEGLTFLSDKTTTKSDVELRLGIPRYTLPEIKTHLYYYKWRTGSVYAEHLWDYYWGDLNRGGVFGATEKLSDIETERMLLIQFDKNDYVVRFGFYKFPNEEEADTLDQIMQDWLTEPLPNYFKPAKLPKRKPKKQEE